MTNPQKSSVLSKLLKEYIRAERIINFILVVIVGLAIAYIGLAAVILCNEGVRAGIAALQPLAFLTSASLLAFAANRQIIHANIFREDQRRRDTARMANHMLAVVRDLANRVHDARRRIHDKNAASVVLVESAKTISDRFESLYERENFLYLTPEATELIHSLSGSIFGLTTLMTHIGRLREKNAEVHYSSDHAAVGIVERHTEAVESVLARLEQMEEELFQLRKSVD